MTRIAPVILILDIGRYSVYDRILSEVWRVLDPMMALDTVDVKRQVRVVMIDGGHRVRAHLNTLGIHIGDWLTVVERAPFKGPVLVEINGTRLAIGRGVAAKIQVEIDGELQPLVLRPPNVEAEQQ
jgi:ferrous iron transport protein A